MIRLALLLICSVIGLGVGMICAGYLMLERNWMPQASDLLTLSLMSLGAVMPMIMYGIVVKIRRGVKH